jgi:hypothetical protein
MTNALRAAACITLCVLAWSAWTLTGETQRVEIKAEALITSQAKSADALEAQATITLASIQDAMTIINRECGGGHPCGTLVDIAKTLGTIRGMAGQIEVAANHEDRRLSVLDGQEAAIYRDTHQGLAELDKTLQAANDMLTRLSPVEVDLRRIIVQSQPILTNLQGMTESGNKILADGAYETHKLTHPNKKKLGFWGSIWAGAKVAHEFEPPIF